MPKRRHISQLVVFEHYIFALSTSTLDLQKLCILFHRYLVSENRPRILTSHAIHLAKGGFTFVGVVILFEKLDQIAPIYQGRFSGIYGFQAFSEPFPDRLGMQSKIRKQGANIINVIDKPISHPLMWVQTLGHGLILLRRYQLSYILNPPGCDLWT